MSDHLRHSARLMLRVFLSYSFLLSALFLVGGSLASAQAQIKFMQGNAATPQTPQTTVTVPYTLAQTLGNLNVVVVGWNDSTATVSSVKDTNGNSYALAATPVVQSGTATQAIYYAKNIAAATAGANSVTVTFTTGAVYPDVRIAEYSGLDPTNPLEISTGSQGNSATSNSGLITTTNLNDLVVGANLVQTFTSGPGAGFTNRIITNPDGDILEDRVVSAAGSYNATASISAGLWIMQIVAFRAAGGGSPPTFTAPSGLTSAAVSPVQINLSWTAATETGGTITQYSIERCAGASCTTFSQIVTVAATVTSFNDTGLAGSTSYSYRVRATDGVNFSGYSNTASATTPAPTFTAPSGLSATTAASNQINLSWTAATETGGTITQYLIERCAGASCTTFSQVIAIAAPATGFSDTSVSASTSYSYRVRVTDGVNSSAYSNIASATTPANSPTAPTSLSATASGPVQINLSWTASTETGGTISQYLIERCTGASCTTFSQITTVAAPATTFNDTGLSGSTSYSYRVRAMDASSVTGPYSNTASATTAAPTFTAPSALTSTAASPAQISLSWTAATETGGTITQYLIERCSGASCTTFAQITTVTSTTTSYNDNTLTGSTNYSYRVRATDGVNFSPYSNTASITTPAPTFTAPSGLTGTAASNTQINLSWTAATEIGGTISNYLVERCTGATCSNFAQVGASATTSFNDTGLATATTYSYRVRATDAASNLGPYSNVASATTTSTTTTNITLVQHTSKDAGIVASSSLAFASNNTGGNWIGVLIRAGKSGQVLTVSDTRGNTYRQAVQFNQTLDAPNGETFAIYYAENIAGGANTVTVSESIPNNTLRLAILEYSGVATANSLDVTAAAQGAGTTLNSGNATTTANGDLVLGEVVTANGQTFTAASGYTIEEAVPAAPNTKLIAEDGIDATAGVVSVGATLSISDNGGAALAAFKAGAGGGTTGPSITSLSPTSGAVGTSVTITGTNFGATGAITFNGTPATPTSWSATSIIVPVPTGATTGNVVVTAGGVISNSANFTVTVPSGSGITLVQHASKNAGTTTSSSLAFTANNTAGNFIAVVVRAGIASQIFAISDSRGNTYRQAVQANLTVDGETIAIYYAESISGGANTVTVSDTISSALRFAILEYAGVAPSNSLDTTVFAQGSDTSPSSGNTKTSGFGDLLIAEITSGSGTTFGAGSGFSMEEVVPAAPGSTLLVEDGIQLSPGLASGTASIAALDNWGAALAAFQPATAGAIGPHILGVSPKTAPVGSQVTITGTNFGATQGASTVMFNGTQAMPISWSSTSIVTHVPPGATSGTIVVTVGGAPSNGLNFNVGFAPPIAFVQVNSSISIDAPLPSSLNFASVPFKGAQTTGNLNVVVAGWHDSTANISSVTDTAGNVYTLAVGPTILSGALSQAIYYAKDILSSPPNTNIVTVTFDRLARSPDIRIAEYAGLDPSNPLDVAVAGQGNGTTSNSNSVSTTSANDLLVGANVVSTASTAAGTGFANRVVTAYGGILEDRIVAVTGSYNATATLSPSGSWIMQLAAFKAPTAAPPPITVSVSPTAATTATGYGAQSLAATLLNDVQHLGVTWTLSGSGCSGSTCGLLSNITPTVVTYGAPSNVPSPATVTLTATSVADPTKAVSATITVTQGTLNVALSPKRAAVTLSQVQQFTAVVTNDPANAGVIWSVDGNNGGSASSGTISSTGLFTPGTQAGVHTVTATSASNASVNVSATIAVTDLQGVFIYHYDSQSTGQNTQEYALTPSNVNSSTFGLLFTCPVDGFMFASPLYVSNMAFGSQKRNVVFIATEHDSVYAFDADSPSCIQLWKTSFLSSGVTPVAPADTGDGVSLVVEFGITSTPVIDPTTNTIYVVANTKEIVGAGCSATSPCYFYRLHALDLTTGAEKLGGPVLITAPNFNPLFQMQRPALLLNNGSIYVGFGAHADLNTWQGWLIGFNAATLAKTFAWSSTAPTGGNFQGGIWHSGNPPVADASGNLYVVTGNGVWDGTQNYSDSVVKLSSTGSVLDYFTPFDQQTLNVNDIDLGASGAIVLPNSVGSLAHPNLLIATGKIGLIYLLDQTNLGKFHSGSNQDVQEVNVAFNTTNSGNGFFGQPAYWNGNLYAVTVGNSLQQYPISNGVITTPASSVANKIYPYRGATPSVSSTGATNGIVWVEDIAAYDSNGPTVLDAYDASHVATMLYSSPVSGPGASGNASKFTVPTVANGKVYVSGSNCFSVFGLLPN